MEIEIVDLDVVQVFLSINPIIALSNFGRQPPAHSGRIELLGIFYLDKIVLLKERLIAVRDNVMQSSASFETIGRTFETKRRTSFRNIAIRQSNSYSMKCG